MKQKLWKAIEAYRTSGGRDEHWRNRDVLDILLDEVLEENARVLAANRDVMLHFDALKQDYDMLVNRQQEPAAYRSRLESGSYTYGNTAQFFDNAEPLYTSPPARKPLTDEEILDMAEWYGDFAWQEASAVGFCRAIEAKHGITGEQHG